MTAGVFERYKDALRRGHVALARNQLDTALAAYREAASLAPDRPLPHAGIGQVLLRRDDPSGALAAFDASLARAPRDEASLRGRADALAALGRRTDAAETLDILSEIQEAAGRLSDAWDTTSIALDLAEQKARRRRLQDLTRRIRLKAGLEAGAVTTTPRGAAPEPEPEPIADPLVLVIQAEAAVDAADNETARDAYLAAAAAFERDGLTAAALDACYEALAFAPDDADVHLRLVQLYIDAGWNAAAADKLALLGRLTTLDDRQGAARRRIVSLAADHFPDDPRLRRLSAGSASRR